MPEQPHLTIDIGNSRIKLGVFGDQRKSADALPACDDYLAVPIDEPDLFDRITEWLSRQEPPQSVWVGSVNTPLLERLLAEWPAGLSAPRAADRSSVSLPVNGTRFPERVGTDRMFNSVAANRLRDPGQPAIIIDSGTATKVDLVNDEGEFCGGAILAGFELIARAFHERTAQLPLIAMTDLAAPPAPVGDETVSAMQSGLYWGLVGGVRELVSRITATLPSEPLIILTGGAAPLLKQHVPQAHYEQTLTLAGIFLASQRCAM